MSTALGATALEPSVTDSLVEFATPRESSPTPDPRYSAVVDPARAERAAAALEAHGFQVVRALDRASARRAVLDRLPSGAAVFDFTSKTLEALELNSDALAKAGYRVLRPSMMQALQGGHPEEARRIASAPDFALGSVHAITEQGQLIVASASGSQLPAYAYGAGQVLWVAGTQKIVPTLEDGLRRLERYAYPLEDARARVAYGRGSAVAKVLILNREYVPGRATVILTPEALGF